MSYEYTTLRTSYPPTDKALNEMASEGWEFMQLVQEPPSGGYAYMSYFRREKE